MENVNIFIMQLTRKNECAIFEHVATFIKEFIKDVLKV